ncbi:MAG: serine hydrolase, partial [Bacteroidetes bacterium]|nr:serine hydrolase [Bacteroidota bacterium]
MKLSKLLSLAGLFFIVSNFVPFEFSCISSTFAQQPPNFLLNPQWADSVFNKLSPDERIAQLFMVAAYSNKDQKHVDEITKLVKEYKIGGLIFFQGGPLRQANLTNYYESLAKVPLMVSIDGEWGLAMRLDSTVQFPKQMTLGAIQDDSLIYHMGAEIAAHCKRIGIHVNLAPVVDVNNNPLNPVIGNRAFGENKYNVARKGIAYMKGMQDNGVMANAKHFPGHGDTDSDSHKTLPLILHSRQRIDSLELYPFKELIANGLGSMMVAHLYIPAYDTTKNLATTLSKVVVTDLLQNHHEFKGLIFTDALNMKGVSKYFAPGIVDVKALLAGNDVLLFAEDVPTAIREIKKAIERGEITQEAIDFRCKKILIAKQWCGLNKYQPIKIKKLYEDLNSVDSEVINRKLTEASLTLLNNKNQLLPLMRLDTLKIASLLIGSKDLNEFQKTLDNYTQVDHFFISKEASSEEINLKIEQLKEYNTVIISVTGTNNNRNKNYGINNSTVDIINKFNRVAKIIVHLPANPYSLAKINGIENVDALIVAYEDNEWSKSYSAQLIFGGIAAKGKLPVTATQFYVEGMGENTLKTRFKYTIPEELCVNSNQLKKIDSLAIYGINQHAYPGCQVFVAKSGNVIYNKSFGYHTYENKIKVKNTDIYDLASITKIAASLAGVMKLHDENLITLDDKLCDFLPSLDSCNKSSVSLRNLLAHQAGFRDWIPFYLKTINKGEYKPGVYSKVKTAEYPFRVAENLYIQKDYPDSIMQRIIHSPVTDKVEYKYSDLGYYLIKEMIERYANMPLEDYSKNTFYAPLGMTTSGFRPREKFPLNRLVPTEYDMSFRKQLIHGDVHDQGAAMLGGVAGHAGLFSNANDLAKLMQMYMQFGEYGGERYLTKEIVQECIKCQFCENENRRGAGFDRPEMNYNKTGPTCKCVSYMSFGHTGFTGTMAWADPENELVYIFLSNRVYPDAENKKLVNLGIR